jgi:membrane associated rhomboid family serine protease
MPRPLALRWSLSQIPRAILWIMAATALVSIGAVVAYRNGAPVAMAGLLSVPEVFTGQVWRLVTWVFYELSPISLVFACLTLYWFGSDVAKTLGRRGFLRLYFGLAALAAAVTCVIGLVWPAVAAIPHGGSWPVLSGVIVAWGMMFREREFRFWMIPMTGRHLVMVTVGGTVLFALYFGLAPFIPHFAAEGAVLLWLGPVKHALAARQKDRRARGEAWTFDAWLDKERRRPK